MSSAGRAARPRALDLPHQPSPSPAEILASLSVQPRTQNILRRFLAEAPTTDGEWTLGRLLTIPGFGKRALDDVMAAQAELQSPRAARRRRHRFLENELSELLATRQRQPGWVATPILDRALALIADDLPASEEELSRRLVNAGVARAPVSLARIERAARFRDNPPPFSVLRREGFVAAVPMGKLALASTVHGLAVRAVVNWGVAQVSRITFLASADRVEMVAAILRAKDTFRWLDEPLGWFWFESPRSPLVRAVTKVLQVVSSADLDELAEALFRHWAPENVPSRRALHTLCSQVPVFRVRRNLVQLADQQGGPVALTPSDQSVVSIFREFGSLIEGHRLPEIALAVGISCSLLGRHLRGSPFVLEPQPGVFRMVGSNGTGN